MGPSITVLALFAHPDDAEFLCAGTLAHLHKHGAGVHLATMTAGDCGSAILPPEKISRIRRGEAARAAKFVQGTYACLGEKDLSVFYDRRTLVSVLGLVRRVRPGLVLTHSPIDYMIDHETTSRIVQTACFGATAPNFRSRGRGASTKPLVNIPHLYYAEPFGGSDIFGSEIRSSLFVDISGTLDLKLKMLACHESQQAWLRSQQGLSDHAGMVRQMARRAGELSGFHWAEGYRQHLGQGFPQDDLLAALLGDLVREARETKPNSRDARADSGVKFSPKEAYGA